MSSKLAKAVHGHQKRRWCMKTLIIRFCIEGAASYSIGTDFTGETARTKRSIFEISIFFPRSIHLKKYDENNGLPYCRTEIVRW